MFDEPRILDGLKELKASKSSPAQMLAFLKRNMEYENSGLEAMRYLRRAFDLTIKDVSACAFWSGFGNYDPGFSDEEINDFLADAIYKEEQ